MLMYYLYTTFFSLHVLWSLNSGPIDQNIIEKLLNYSVSFPQEKVYLHTDKSVYATGEDVWFKAYLMMGPNHVPDTITGVLYVELINTWGSVIDRKKIRIQDGLGWGDFHLPQASSPGKYMLKAYTRYMMNFDPAFHYRKPIRVISSSNQPTEELASETGTSVPLEDSVMAPVPTSFTMDFFPEGGHMVSGLQNFVAFKASDNKGSGIDIAGTIKDQDRTEITTFASKKFGLGFFSFTPEGGKRYFAEVNWEGEDFQFDLPEALNEGYAMHIRQKADKVYIWVRNNLGINMDNSFIVGQFRGYPFITIHAESGKDYIYTVFSVKEMPTGVIHLTFFDAQGIPHCERLVYSDNANEVMQVDVETDKKKYRKREEITFNIHCQDNAGGYPLTNISVSVLNDSIFMKDAYGGNITSYFNLESELKGYIENPSYYFNPEHDDRAEMLDILLMTHGWRRFVWEKILEEDYEEFVYSPELGFNFEGSVFQNLNMTKPAAGKVRMFIYEGQFYYNEIETGDDGRFSFYGVNFYDSTQIVMQAWEEQAEDEKRKKRRSPEIRKKLAIKIDARPFDKLYPDLWPELTILQNKGYDEYYELNELISKIDSSFEGRTIVMSGITVEDLRIDMNDPFYRPGKLHGEPMRRIVMDSLPVSEQAILFFELVRKYYPNVNYTGTPPNINVTIRGQRSIYGSNNAIFMLDGVEVTSDFLYYFPVTEIDFIDVLSSIGASIYGSGSMGGAILVFTRERQPFYSTRAPDWVHNFSYPGYYRTREFYTPNYSMPEEKHIKPDFRRTLYWNPSLTTDNLGNIECSFFTSDEVARYRVEIEGMTWEGLPIREEYYFSVE